MAGPAAHYDVVVRGGRGGALRATVARWITHASAGVGPGWSSATWRAGTQRSGARQGDGEERPGPV
jgi:hypothetical protein